MKVLEFQKLTFAHAQEEIARLKAAKAQRARASPQTTSAPSSRKNSVSSPNQSQGTLPQPPSGSPADETGEKSNDEPLEMSEKARGKLPATDYSADLPPIPLYDSKGKFIPTLEWVSRRFTTTFRRNLSTALF